MTRPLPDIGADLRELLTERRRGIWNSYAAFIAALAAGYCYAQLARAFAAPPASVGPIAIVVEVIVFICGHQARLGEHAARWLRRKG